MSHKFAGVILLFAFAYLSGCAYLAGGMAHQEGRPVAAEYAGLDGKSVAVVVYATRATTNEFSAARDEISAFVVTELRKALPACRIVDPRVVIRWQDDTLNWDSLAEHDIGKHFGVERVLFIELVGYETKVPGAQGYVQGYIEANAKVFEVDTPGTLPAWQGSVVVKWPPDGPIDMMRVSELAVRKNALQKFGEKIAGYMHAHKEQDDTMRDKAGYPH